MRFGADGVASFIKLGEAINPCLSGQSESQYNVCEHAKELFGTSVKCIGGGGADVSKDHGELTPNAHVPCSPAKAEEASSHAQEKPSFSLPKSKLPSPAPQLQFDTADPRYSRIPSKQSIPQIY